MQLRKFYGRTMAGALAQVRRELGPEALLLETRTLEAGSAAERMNPGARYEICAVREAATADAPHFTATVDGRESTESPVTSGVQFRATAGATAATASPATKPAAGAHLAAAQLITAAPRRDALLRDLGHLRRQIHDLLDGPVDTDTAALGVDGQPAGALELIDYHTLLEQGVEAARLAPHFRQWLRWRTATPVLRRYLARRGEVEATTASAMEGESLREWLWRAWAAEQNRLDAASDVAVEDRVTGPAGVVLLGGSGVGKTSTMAMLASIFRQDRRQNAAVICLDGARLSAADTWRRLGKLLGIHTENVLTQEDLSMSMERWGQFDWIGVDTGGNLKPGSEQARVLGRLLAHCPQLQTVQVLPATQQEAVSRSQMKSGQTMGATQIIFTKLDEQPRAGSLLNLTLGGGWRIAGMTSGTRVPVDFAPAGADRAALGRALWEQVLAPVPARELAGGAR